MSRQLQVAEMCGNLKNRRLMPPKKKKATEPDHQSEAVTDPGEPVPPTDTLEEFAGDPFDI